MKRIIYIILILLFSISKTNACEVCGCGGSNTYIGLLPEFKTKFIGLRYNTMYYKTQMAMDATQFSHNYYQTTELWAGLNVGKHWKLLAFVPYHFNKQEDDEGTTSTNGLGDITLMANYKLWDKTFIKGNRGFIHQIWIGGGIKLPAGKFDVNTKDPALTVADVNAQLGTGSTDFIFNTIYNVKMGNWGINTTLSYKVNGTKDEYSFGNKFTANSIAYYRYVCKNGYYVSPNVGLIYENTAQNSLKGESVISTGGYISSGSVGVELTMKKLSLGINAQLPISQHYADGQTEMKWRANTHISFAL